jgi:ketosteroid isomerase-like protein
MGDAIGCMTPVNVFPLIETILHWSDWLRQGLVVYYRSLMLQVAGVSWILVATTVLAAPTETPNTSAVAQIQSVLRTQQDAWNRGDIDGFMDGYARAPSTVFISQDEVRRGWETVRQRYHEKYSDRTKMGTLSFSDIEITPLSADAAVVLGRWSLKRANDQPHGRFTLILKRLAEGWRIVHDHTSAAQ